MGRAHAIQYLFRCQYLSLSAVRIKECELDLFATKHNKKTTKVGIRKFIPPHQRNYPFVCRQYQLHRTLDACQDQSIQFLAFYSSQLTPQAQAWFAQMQHPSEHGVKANLKQTSFLCFFKKSIFSCQDGQDCLCALSDECASCDSVAIDLPRFLVA